MNRAMRGIINTEFDVPAKDTRQTSGMDGRPDKFLPRTAALPTLGNC